jgi:hypothetical protein
MEDEFSCIENDAKCLSEIEDFGGGLDTLKWLDDHLGMYVNVTYGPKYYMSSKQSLQSVI